MSLHAKYPNVLLVPTADIALMWAAHMGLSQQYAEACAALFGESKAEQLWEPAYQRLTPEYWWMGYAATKAMYEQEYGEGGGGKAPAQSPQEEGPSLKRRTQRQPRPALPLERRCPSAASPPLPVCVSPQASCMTLS